MKIIGKNKGKHINNWFETAFHTGNENLDNKKSNIRMCSKI